VCSCAGTTRGNESLTGTTRLSRATEASHVPLLSIGLPTFNRAQSLVRAIESVLAQEFCDFELIISDNASSDSTQSLCGDFCSKDNRVRYIRQPANQGAYANFYSVLSAASGQYFMWLSDDDWLDEAYLARCLSELKDHPDLALVCGSAKYVDESGNGFDGVVVNLLEDSPAQRVLSYYRQVNDNGTFYGVVRRSALVANHMQNVLGADWILIATLAVLGKIRTLENVHINRSSAGASADVRSLAKRHGFSERAARQPHRTIARSVFRNIALESPVFSRFGLASRWTLAVRCAITVHTRFVVSENPMRTLPRRIRSRLMRAVQLS
jgi:glycosyltransferase involved in cell wall biosynthesis